MNESAKIIRAARLFKKSVLIIGACLAFAVYATSPVARAADAEAVTINTTFTVFTPPVRLESPAREARASVVLMANANGLLGLDTTGTILSDVGDFLIRSADIFLRNDLNVMIADAAPAFPSGLTGADRVSATHAAELQGFINAAINRWGKPVWVIGTGGGSISAVTAGGFQPALAGLKGVVMTSTVPPSSTAVQATFNLYASRITVPALVVWHQNDQCAFSPPAGSTALFAAIPAIGKASAPFQGGHSVADNPCDNFSEHGYAGIEEEVVEKIAEFIRRTDIE
jgi:hypothetical protein